MKTIEEKFEINGVPFLLVKTSHQEKIFHKQKQVSQIDTNITDQHSFLINGDYYKIRIEHMPVTLEFTVEKNGKEVKVPYILSFTDKRSLLCALPYVLVLIGGFLAIIIGTIGCIVNIAICRSRKINPTTKIILNLLVTIGCWKSLMIVGRMFMEFMGPIK